MQPQKTEQSAKDSLDTRLQEGARIINHRLWGKRSSLRYIRETTERYPEHVAVWVQAFTVAIKAERIELAMMYRTKAEILGAGDLERGAMERDMALYHLQQNDLPRARAALARARQYHANQADRNLAICLDVVEARLIEARGGRDAPLQAYRQMWRARRAYSDLRSDVNTQWQFNLWMLMMRNCYRRWDEDSRVELRRNILHSPCCTWRHRWALRLMRLPGGWRLLPR